MEEEVEVEGSWITGVTDWWHPQPEADTSRYAYVELLKCCFMFHALLFSGGGRENRHTGVRSEDKKKTQHSVEKLRRRWSKFIQFSASGWQFLIIYSGWIKYQNDLCQSKTVWRNVLLTDNVSIYVDIIISKYMLYSGVRVSPMSV